MRYVTYTADTTYTSRYLDIYLPSSSVSQQRTAAKHLRHFNTLLILLLLLFYFSFAVFVVLVFLFFCLCPCLTNGYIYYIPIYIPYSYLLGMYEWDSEIVKCTRQTHIIIRVVYCTYTRIVSESINQQLIWKKKNTKTIFFKKYLTFDCCCCCCTRNNLAKWNL